MTRFSSISLACHELLLSTNPALLAPLWSLEIGEPHKSFSFFVKFQVSNLRKLQVGTRMRGRTSSIVIQCLVSRA